MDSISQKKRIDEYKSNVNKEIKNILSDEKFSIEDTSYRIKDILLEKIYETCGFDISNSTKYSIIFELVNFYEFIIKTPKYEEFFGNVSIPISSIKNNIDSVISNDSYLDKDKLEIIITIIINQIEIIKAVEDVPSINKILVICYLIEISKKYVSVNFK